MPPWLIYLLPVLWFCWVIEAVLAAVKVRHFARRIGAGEKPFIKWQPRATVIVPFKGVQDNPERALRPLLEQDYPDYRLCLVVESEDDPACAVLRRALAARPEADARVIVAGRAPSNIGQKVHNQRVVLRMLDQECADDEVWAFADSDAVPDGHWLRSMVGPLIKPHRGMTTGYRWLVPEPDAHGRVGLWSHLASVINSSVACQAGFYDWHQAWGGAMALRVETARRGRLLGRLDGALTDDYPMTRMCRELGLEVYFARPCLVLSPAAFTFRSLWNFGHRQYLITRVYAPGLYVTALLLLSLWVAGFVSALGAMVAAIGWVPGAGTLPGSLGVVGAFAMALVAAADQVRSHYRAAAVRTAFGRAALGRLRTTLRYDRWATPVWTCLHWAIVVRAAVGRTMTWRGITYRLLGPNRVERLKG